MIYEQLYGSICVRLVTFSTSYWVLIFLLCMYQIEENMDMPIKRASDILFACISSLTFSDSDAFLNARLCFNKHNW